VETGNVGKEVSTLKCIYTLFQIFKTEAVSIAVKDVGALPLALLNIPIGQPHPVAAAAVAIETSRKPQK